MLFVFAMSMTALAQSKDFAGSWVLDPEKSGTTQGPPAVIIKMTPAEFRLKLGSDDQEVLFKLDGSETEQPNGNRSKAVWKGSKLEATLTMSRGAQSITFSREGAWLVLERESSRGPSKLYLKKAPPK